MGHCAGHGAGEINGAQPFSIPAEKFIISPLQSNSDIYIDSIINGVEMEKVKIGNTDAGDYTTVINVIPNTVFHVDTTEKFYVKY